MNHARSIRPLFCGPQVMAALAALCCACASSSSSSSTSAPHAAAPTASAHPDHQAVIDRLTDQANDLCRVSGQEAKVLQVGTTDLTREPESRHIVYECVEPQGTDADEASAEPDTDPDSDEQ